MIYINNDFNYFLIFKILNLIKSISFLFSSSISTNTHYSFGIYELLRILILKFYMIRLALFYLVLYI